MPVVLWLSCAVAGAPVAPPGGRAELVAESLTVQLGPKSCTVVVEPTVATNAARVALVWRVPRPAQAELAERGLGDRLAAIVRASRPVVWHARPVWTTTPRAWRMWRAGDYGAAVAGATVVAAGTGGRAEMAWAGAASALAANLRAWGFEPSPGLDAWADRGAPGEVLLAVYHLGRRSAGLRAVALPA
ncbi:MAG: hypothetical protein HYU66_28925, partial [Armatimonadetes bacterium]|nr:hypothetical protein [Armatimonadota bacterium]